MFFKIPASATSLPELDGASVFSDGPDTIFVIPTGDAVGFSDGPEEIYVIPTGGAVGFVGLLNRTTK